MNVLRENKTTVIITLAVLILGFILGRQRAEKLEEVAPSSQINFDQSRKFTVRSDSGSNSLKRFRPEWATPNARSRNPAEAERMLEDLLKWAERDPLAALAYVVENTRPLDQKELYVTAILGQWALESPEEAWSWACTHSVNDCTDLLQQIGKVDSKLAWEYAHQHVAAKPSQKQQAYEQALLGIVYEEKYREALDLVVNLEIANDLEFESGRYYYVEGVVEKWFLYDPKAGQDWLKEMLEEGDVSVMRKAVSTLKASWAIREPKDALDFALELPNGEARESITEAALDSIIDQDEFTYAMDWLNEHGSGATFDHTVSRIATDNGLIATDATVAIGWANSIEQQSLRDDALGYLYAEWMTQDEQAASAYLAKLEEPLSEDASERMEAILKERKEGIPLTEEEKSIAQ